MLREDLAAPRKQRHTIQRIHDRLAAEHGVQAGVLLDGRATREQAAAEIEAEARGAG